MVDYAVNPALATVINATVIYREFDQAALMVERAKGSPVCLRCGKCCRENTPFAYGWEAANAVSRLIGEGRLYPMQRRLEGWLLDRHRECLTYEPMTVDRVTFGLEDRLRDEALALSGTPCPLFEDGRCLVYEYRPLVCRAFGVTRDTPGCPLERSVILAPHLRKELRLEAEAILDNVPKLTWKSAGFLPTLIFAHAWPAEYSKHTANGLIATAKAVMTYPSLALLWQEQVESLTERDLFRDGQKVVSRG